MVIWLREFPRGTKSQDTNRQQEECSRYPDAESCSTTQDKRKRMRKWHGGELHWLKHNACTGIIPTQKSHWPMNEHLNNEGQEWKAGHSKGRALTRGGG
jgi:hypothetical protein